MAEADTLAPPQANDGAAQPAESEAKPDAAQELLSQHDGASEDGTASQSEGTGREEAKAEEQPDFIAQEIESARKLAQETAQSREQEETQRAEAARKEQEAARRQGVVDAYNRRAPAIRAFLEGKVDDGEPLTREDVNLVLNTFTNQHQDYSSAIQAQWTDAFGQAFKSLLPDFEPPNSDAPEELLSAFYEEVSKSSRKGFLSDTDVNARVTDARLGLIRDLLDPEKPLFDQLAARRNVPASRSGGIRTGVAGSFRTKSDARNAHARGEISNAEMRRINADPSIPESGDEP